MILSAAWRWAMFGAYCDLFQSFRRSILGTLWYFLALLVMAFGVGLFFGTVLQQLLPPYREYLPHVLIGLALWWFMSATVNEAATVFSRNLNVLRYAQVPFEAFVIRIWLRHAVILVQNLCLIVILLAGLGLIKNLMAVLLSAIGTLLLMVNVLYASQIVALLSARFRDLPQTISWLLNLGFLLTPIIWMGFMTGRYQDLLTINPFHHFLAIVRYPLLEGVTPVLSLAVSASTAAGFVLLWRFLWRWAAPRLPYWI